MPRLDNQDDGSYTSQTSSTKSELFLRNWNIQKVETHSSNRISEKVKNESGLTFPEGPAGMDIHPYLHTLSNLAPNLCKHIGDDLWQFTFSDASVVVCDVVSFHGTATIEDLIKENINKRDGWQYELIFDRNAETFSAQVSIAPHTSFYGQESLNPSIALLSAFLHALNS